MNAIDFMLASALAASLPLLLAALGEMVVEKTGLLNLGLEGMMEAGPVCVCASAYVYALAYVCARVRVRVRVRACVPLVPVSG